MPEVLELPPLTIGKAALRAQVRYSTPWVAHGCQRIGYPLDCASGQPRTAQRLAGTPLTLGLSHICLCRWETSPSYLERPFAVHTHQLGEI